jgi:hypothetical protein
VSIRHAQKIGSGAQADLGHLCVIKEYYCESEGKGKHCAAFLGRFPQVEALSHEGLRLISGKSLLLIEVVVLNQLGHDDYF